MAQFNISEAKARFSELVEKAHAGPQTVTRNGKPVAIVVGIDEWTRRTERKGTLADFFMSSPLRGAELDMTRDKAGPREIDL